MILFNTSFGLEIVFSGIFGVSFFPSYVVAVYSLLTYCTINRANTEPSKPCFDSLCPSALLQSDPVKSPTDMLSTHCSFEMSPLF